ncbi:unnamed protein product [Staurois parvus]|uniref:Uncharacterized protein n=1 Tax=Staurois parvus TaxID=386267 RepID=A0ABN9CUG6_9NEOB|nr:unnamed protein product [Staurois parvus]
MATERQHSYMALIGDTERQLRWALICGIDVHWQALICGTDGHWQVALMSTDSWH